MPLLSIIVPIYNEESNLEELYNRLRDVSLQISQLSEFIIVDDGSKDNSFHIISILSKLDNRVRYIRFTRNFGHQIALQAGLEAAKGDFVAIIDGDLQDPPELLPLMLQKIENEKFEIVYAKRLSRKSESFLKKLTATLFYRILNKVSKINIPLDTGDFRLMTQRVVKEIIKMEEPNKFLRGQISWLGYPQTFLEYERDGRKTGKSNYSYGKMFRLAFDGITGFSDFPLKFASFSGIAVSFLSFLLIIYALVGKLILHQTVSGWTSIITAILFIGGIQLLSIGIIGEYISRLNDASRKRPLYIVSESNIELKEISKTT